MIDEEQVAHQARVERAGCKHPAVYPWGALGWCDLCRADQMRHMDDERRAEIAEHVEKHGDAMRAYLDGA